LYLGNFSRGLRYPGSIFRPVCH